VLDLGVALLESVLFVLSTVVVALVGYRPASESTCLGII
jgi:hypothetical protein